MYGILYDYACKLHALFKDKLCKDNHVNLHAVVLGLCKAYWQARSASTSAAMFTEC